ncbi:MAG: tetratricopeptide repeat protein [Nitrospirota bacterium]|nr:tetratricopeptide repeat protein [Nitrospirota bacterium]
MSKFFLFALLYWLLGNPFVALLVILIIYFTIDRTYFGFIPDPFKAFKKAGRIRELHNIVAINPYDARSLKELGIFMIDKKDYRKAREYFEKAADKMSDDPEFNYYYGLSVARSGEIGKGRELLDAALKKSPSLKYGEPYIMFAEVYIDNGDYAGALPLLERFGSIHSSSSRGFYQMGAVKLKLGMNAEGKDYLRKAIAAFKASPRFKRKVDRRWAWKARALLRKAL